MRGGVSRATEAPRRVKGDKTTDGAFGARPIAVDRVEFGEVVMPAREERIMGVGEDEEGADWFVDGS